MSISALPFLTLASLDAALWLTRLVRSSAFSNFIVAELVLGRRCVPTLLSNIWGKRGLRTCNKRRKAEPLVDNLNPRNKIDLQKIHASVNTICTLCGFTISPADVQ